MATSKPQAPSPTQTPEEALKAELEAAVAEGKNAYFVSEKVIRVDH